jgi:hypothetical protein
MYRNPSIQQAQFILVGVVRVQIVASVLVEMNWTDLRDILRVFYTILILLAHKMLGIPIQKDITIPHLE